MLALELMKDCNVLYVEGGSGVPVVAMEHPIFEIVTTAAGAISIRNKVVNEIMHNPVGPWKEANSLYIDQCRLREKLLASAKHPLVIFDVGLGAAANALAALHCLQNIGKSLSPRKMKIVSFERDLDLLRFALSNASQFEHFEGYQEIMKELLAQGNFENESFSWVIRHGDFTQLIDTEETRADLVFFDPYSPQVNLEMWTTSCFSKLRQKCRESHEGGTELYTYSIATPVRSALLVSGFFVGHGSATGLKTETTQGSTRLSDINIPLGARWLERWKKSHTRYPFGSTTDMHSDLVLSVLTHKQFQLLPEELTDIKLFTNLG